MFRTVVVLSIFISNLMSSGNISMIYTIDKGGKKLGAYEITFIDKKNAIISKSYGVASKVSYFVDKKIIKRKDGYRVIAFTKNSKTDIFNLYTKLSAIDKETKSKYKRLLGKVKGKEMLLITKSNSSSTELFNKRPTRIYTLDEILKMVKDGTIKEGGFLLFDKSGVMKMIASIKKTEDGYMIVNKSKKSDYLSIEISNSKPVLIKSMVSDWSMKLSKVGVYKTYKLKSKRLKEIAKEAMIGDLPSDADMDSVKIKISKTNYILKYKNAKGKKKSIKTQKVYIEKMALKELYAQYPILKKTKKYKIKKNTIYYKILKER